VRRNRKQKYILTLSCSTKGSVANVISGTIEAEKKVRIVRLKNQKDRITRMMMEKVLGGARYEGEKDPNKNDRVRHWFRRSQDLEKMITGTRPRLEREGGSQRTLGGGNRKSMSSEKF